MAKHLDPWFTEWFSAASHGLAGDHTYWAPSTPALEGELKALAQSVKDEAVREMRKKIG